MLPSLPAVALLLARTAQPWLNKSLSKYSKFALILALSLVPLASIVLGMVSLTQPNRLKTEKTLINAAVEEMKVGKKLYYIDNRPFSARFYSRGQAMVVSTEQLEGLVKTERSILIAVSKNHRLDVLKALPVKLKRLFSNRRYVLYELDLT
ncbi:hypothetical protein ACSBPU_18850 [Parapusillimonas sp. JC17]|uniref:hypothetical protein n=1 Tax=Parapusillimonas sp. JC17 TaxID=3445768 RepID=UPI003F9EC1E9